MTSISISDNSLLTGCCSATTSYEDVSMLVVGSVMEVCVPSISTGLAVCWFMQLRFSSVNARCLGRTLGQSCSTWFYQEEAMKALAELTGKSSSVLLWWLVISSAESLSEPHRLNVFGIECCSCFRYVAWLGTEDDPGWGIILGICMGSSFFGLGGAGGGGGHGFDGVTRLNDSRCMGVSISRLEAPVSCAGAENDSNIAFQRASQPSFSSRLCGMITWRGILWPS